MTADQHVNNVEQHNPKECHDPTTIVIVSCHTSHQDEYQIKEHIRNEREPNSDIPLNHIGRESVECSMMSSPKEHQKSVAA
jgi:hypothetical protein